LPHIAHVSQLRPVAFMAAAMSLSSSNVLIICLMAKEYGIKMPTAKHVE
jgi:hypothetical protein